MAVTASRDAHAAELLYLTMVRFPIGPIEILVTNSTLADDIQHKLGRIGMRDGMRRVAIAAKGGPD